MNIIESSSNRKIKNVKELLDKKKRWANSKFIIEGIRGVEQVIDSSYNILNMVCSESLFQSKRGKSLIEKGKDLELNIIYTNDKVFKELVDTKSPQWVLVVAEFSFAKLKSLLEEGKKRFILVDRVQDPGNLGTIVRTGEALGLDGIIITEGSVDIYSPKTIRSSMGSILQIPIVYYKDIKNCLTELRENNIDIISTSLNTENKVYSVEYGEKTAIVVGNEGMGVSKEIEDASDVLVQIPMIGKADSLNVGVATGIVIYEILRQQLNSKS